MCSRAFVSVCMLTVLLANAGCMTTDELAPPAEVVIGGLSSSSSATVLCDEDRAEIAHGRFLYITECAACHAPERVLAHTMNAWDEILPRMAKESKFSDAETAAVRAYVAAVHRWGDPRAGNTTPDG